MRTKPHLRPGTGGWWECLLPDGSRGLAPTPAGAVAGARQAQCITRAMRQEWEREQLERERERLDRVVSTRPDHRSLRERIRYVFND